MRVTNAVKAQVKATLVTCIAKANARYPNHTFTMPSVIYKKRGKTAGTACDEDYEIDLNSVLLMENVDAFMARTVVHEFGHLVDGIVNPGTRSGRGKRSIHGPTWKTIMRMLGGPTSRCHTYDVTNSRIKRKPKPKHVYTCACGSPAATMKLGAKRHRNHTSGVSNFAMRGHRGPGHGYTYVGLERLAPAPVRLAASAARPPKRTKKVTKLDRCRDAFVAARSRDHQILLFVRDCDCTPAGASTYYAKIKKERS